MTLFPGRGSNKAVFFFICDRIFFGTWALVPLGVGPVLAPSDLLCNFSFPSYVFVREPIRRAKKSSPTPLWGHRLPVTTLARGLDKSKQHSVFRDEFVEVLDRFWLNLTNQDLTRGRKVEIGNPVVLTSADIF